MEIYIYIVAAVLIFGAIMPQKGSQRIWYILLMTLIHTFVTGFRYEHLTGDLIMYHAGFNLNGSYGWLSPELFHEGKNFGFHLLNKLVYVLFDGNFQALLLVIALIIYLIIAYVVFRYSTAPWMSYLIWNCMAFFLFDLSSIRQALAMAFLLLTFTAITDRRPFKFLLMTAIAGSIHMPALIFLPTYFFCTRRTTPNMIILYLIMGFALYIFRDQFVSFIQSFYYDEDEVFVYSGRVGSRFIMILGFTLFGLLFTGLRDQDFEMLFPIMVIAAMLQLLSGYDNIFTRLTDYYFQFSVLYLPMVFFPDGRKPQTPTIHAALPFNRRSLKLLASFVCIFMLWFYYTYNLNITIEYQVDNYLDFRFMWDVVS